MIGWRIALGRTVIRTAAKPQAGPVSLLQRLRQSPILLALCLLSLGLGAIAGFGDPLRGLKLAAPGLALLVLYYATGPSPWSLQPLGLRPTRAELLGVAGLLLAASLLLGYRLGSLPQGAAGHEGILAGDYYRLKDRPYEEHSGTAYANWCTFVLYEGAAAGKLLGGDSPARFRLPSVLWGLLAVLSIYGVARAMLSPGTALLLGLLFAADGDIILWSRNFFPGSILQFAELAALYFMLYALRGGRHWLALLAAGFCVSLGPRGYMPGYVLPPVFFFWLLFWPRQGAGAVPWRRRGLILAGFAAGITSLVLFYFRVKGDGFWSYVGSVNPSQGGLRGYWSTFTANLPAYLRLFNLQGDVEACIPYRPWLPPLSGLLFLGGLLIGLRRAFSREHSILFMLLFAGLVPAILGGAFAHPTTRRAMLSLPIAYLFVGVGIEGLRAWIQGLAGSPGFKRGLLALGALLCLSQAVYSAWTYYGHYVTDLNRLWVGNHLGWRLRDLAERQGCSSVTTSGTFEVMSTEFVFAGMPRNGLREPEDVLRAKLSGRSLFALDPVYAGAEPFLRAALPGAPFWRQPNLFQTTVQPELQDHYVPGVLYCAMVTGEEERSPVDRLRLRGPGIPEGQLQLWGEALPAGAQGRWSLEGSLILPRGGATLRALAKQPGLQAVLNGRPLAWDRPFLAPGGLNDLVVRGQGRGTGFPLELQIGSVQAEGEPARLVSLPLRWSHGWQVRMERKGSTPLLLRHPYPAWRFGDDYYRGNMSVELRSVLTWPKDGLSQLTAVKECKLRIWMDGDEVFCNWRDRQPIAKALRVRAGQRSHLRIAYDGSWEDPLRAFQLRWALPGVQGAVPVPMEALAFEDLGV